MGFLEVKPEILRTFLKNSGKILRPFFGIFVAIVGLSQAHKLQPGCILFCEI